MEVYSKSKLLTLRSSCWTSLGGLFPQGDARVTEVSLSPSCKHLWKALQLEGWLRFETDTCAGLLMQETPHSYSDMSHLLHLCMYKSQTASEPHRATHMFCYPAWRCSHSSEPQGRAVHMLLGKGSNKNTTSSVKSKRFFNTTERWVTRKSSPFPLCQNSIGTLYCHHSIPKNREYQFYAITE